MTESRMNCPICGVEHFSVPAGGTAPGGLQSLLTRVPVEPASAGWDEPAEVCEDGGAKING